MTLTDPQFARSQVLRIFDEDEVYLLLGAAITTIGLVAAAFSALRRRLDPLVLWFAAFAVLYGVRLITEYQPMWALGVHAKLLSQVGLAINYLVPIPAFFFIRTLNLTGRLGRILAQCIWPLSVCLTIITLVFGYRKIVEDVNNISVAAALLVLLPSLFLTKHSSPDTRPIRNGLLFFSLCALYNNTVRLFPHYYNIEPFSFIVLLVCLGIVAGRRTLAQEQELSTIQKELEVARRIQLSILPANFPPSIHFSVAARYLPMTSVAGDFYDFLIANDQQAGLLIADVSGHGVPAALIASMVKLAAAAQSAHVAKPSDLLSNMNTTLYGNTQSQFVTAAYVYLDAAEGMLFYSGAAHPPMLLLRNGEVSKIIENGLMLAAFSFATYTTVSHPIRRGDRLLLYTDGIVEAADSSSEEFGEERLCGLLRETAKLSNTDAADHIIKKIQDWAKLQNDDLTVLVCDYARS